MYYRLLDWNRIWQRELYDCRLEEIILKMMLILLLNHLNEFWDNSVYEGRSLMRWPWIIKKTAHPPCPTLLSAIRFWSTVHLHSGGRLPSLTMLCRSWFQSNGRVFAEPALAARRRNQTINQFLLERSEKTLHARVIKAAVCAAHTLSALSVLYKQRTVLPAGVLLAVVGMQDYTLATTH